MKNYYRIMLGKRGVHSIECFSGNFVGVDYGINQDLTNQLPDDWREFNRKFIPVFLERNPGKSRIAAGLACGAIHTVCKGIQTGEMVISPDGEGNYHIGEVTGGYYFHPEGILPHRRTVNWMDRIIKRNEMSVELRHSTGAAGAVINIAGHAEELELLIGGLPKPEIIATDDTIEDPATFALEKHLQEFLVQNWKNTSLGKEYRIFEDEGEQVGEQYLTDTGAIDILAVSKDGKTILVVELKKGRASDVVVGQILRYMGYVKEELAEPGQAVRGIIIAMEDDQRLHRALAMVPDIDFYRYEVTFKLRKSIL